MSGRRGKKTSLSGGILATSHHRAGAAGISCWPDPRRRRSNSSRRAGRQPRSRATGPLSACRRPSPPSRSSAPTARPRPRSAPLPWTSQEVTTPYTQGRRRRTARCSSRSAGNDYVCSGTALLSGNKSVVWTAGHCVNEGPGDFATNWEFVPAYKDGSAPLGVYVADEPDHSSAWANSGDISYDFGAAVVAPSGGTALTDRVGGRGIAFNTARSQNYVSYGYPAAPPFTGERLWTCNSPLQRSDSTTSPQTLGIGCDMTGGSSGGGWIVGGNLVSENSYGYDNQPNVMYGPYLGSVAQSVYNAAAAD